MAFGATILIASKTGVNMPCQSLRGAELQAVKDFFQRLGIVFTRRPVEKATGLALAS